MALEPRRTSSRRSYRERFALECRAIRKVRDEIGFRNLIVTPSLRRVLCISLRDGFRVRSGSKDKRRRYARAREFRRALRKRDL